MKTIFVIYTDTKKEYTGHTKRYAFNTTYDVKVGDMLSSNRYTSKMQVVEVLDYTYKYFNKVSGDLTNAITNSNLFPIRVLEISTSLEDAIPATIVNE